MDDENIKDIKYERLLLPLMFVDVLSVFFNSKHSSILNGHCFVHWCIHSNSVCRWNCFCSNRSICIICLPCLAMKVSIDLVTSHSWIATRGCPETVVDPWSTDWTDCFREIVFTPKHGYHPKQFSIEWTIGAFGVWFRQLSLCSNSLIMDHLGVSILFSFCSYLMNPSMMKLVDPRTVQQCTSKEHLDVTALVNLAIPMNAQIAVSWRVQMEAVDDGKQFPNYIYFIGVTTNRCEHIISCPTNAAHTISIMRRISRLWVSNRLFRDEVGYNHEGDWKDILVGVNSLSICGHTRFWCHFPHRLFLCVSSYAPRCRFRRSNAGRFHWGRDLRSFNDTLGSDGVSRTCIGWRGLHWHSERSLGRARDPRVFNLGRCSNLQRSQIGQIFKGVSIRSLRSECPDIDSQTGTTNHVFHPSVLERIRRNVQRWNRHRIHIQCICSWQMSR